MLSEKAGVARSQIKATLSLQSIVPALFNFEVWFKMGPLDMTPDPDTCNHGL